MIEEDTGDVYLSQFGSAIEKTLATYGHLPRVLVRQLEKIVLDAQARVRGAVEAEIASTVCENLHDGPAGGLKCLKCYQAEQTFYRQAEIEAERAISQLPDQTGSDPNRE